LFVIITRISYGKKKLAALQTQQNTDNEWMSKLYGEAQFLIPYFQRATT
jgi:hypothetical protein